MTKFYYSYMNVLLDWFKSYSFDKFQFLHLKYEVSSDTSVSHGILQGYGLGLIL